ncbi:N-6 DNA methylase [Streptosporangium soli]|nr:SAM-dependent methyltransferase [Streptosporangium sp. KLBMP 9127]
MSSDSTVNAGDIARLADVGRAAVSNWRRRYDDFPQPVGGTAASPLFSLTEVEGWLRKNGKSFEVSLGDRVWQRLRAAGDDLRLPHLVGGAGALLLFLHRDPGGWRQAGDLAGLSAAVAAATGDLPQAPIAGLDLTLAGLIADLAAELGPAEAFELLCARYAEAHSRRLDVTRGEIASLMVRLACGGATTVLDPACGTGTLLIAAGAARSLGQDSSDTAALIAAVRLLLRGSHAEIIAADALRSDGFAGKSADAVICDPPFNERAWGFDELTGDPRWEYGLPPRGESELAWVQHCLARVRPGGTVAILMPSAAASRRPGRRIRGNLLRTGALRGIVSLSPTGPDLWLLRRPAAGERPPSRLLVMDAGEELDGVEPAWLAYSRDPEADPPGAGRTIRIIDLLDDEVDLSPARHRPRQRGAELTREFAAAREGFQTASALLATASPALDPANRAAEPLMVSVGELVKAGLVAIHQAPFKMVADQGDVPVLTADDLTADGPPTGRTRRVPGLVRLEAGDIVTTFFGVVRVLAEGGPALGPQLTVYRVDHERLDPDFLAGFLRLAGTSGAGRAHPGASRADARRARVPRLPLSRQQEYGGAFRQLVALEAGLRETAALGQTLVRLGFEGLVDGYLEPPDQGGVPFG